NDAGCLQVKEITRAPPAEASRANCIADSVSVTIRRGLSDGRGRRENSGALRDQRGRYEIHADAVSARVSHRLDCEYQPDAAVPVSAGPGRDDLSAGESGALWQARRCLQLLFRDYGPPRGAARLWHFQAETCGFTGIRGTRGNRRGGYRQLCR